MITTRFSSLPVCLWIALLGARLVAHSTAADPPAPPDDDGLLKMIKDRTAMERVTGPAAVMDPQTAALCVQPPPKPVDVNPHWIKHLHIYVSPEAAEPLWDPLGKFPQGAVILKEKLPAGDAGKPDLFTGMIKRERGFNEACGDWEFFTADGAASKITSRGKLQNCIECHKGYAASDFVTRACTGRNLVAPLVQQMTSGTVVCHSCRATVHGKTLRYEPQAEKNTLGYWTDPADWADWPIAIDKPGTFIIDVLQGCGKGSGGSEIEVSVGDQKVTFTVEDTGHFQNFVRREIGTVKIETAGPVTLAVKPRKKPGAAVMDLREVMLRPVKSK